MLDVRESFVFRHGIVTNLIKVKLYFKPFFKYI